MIGRFVPGPVMRDASFDGQREPDAGGGGEAASTARARSTRVGTGGGEGEM